MAIVCSFSKNLIEADLLWMKRAIQEAKKGRGKTAPNPIVGAIIVHAGKILSTGYHIAAGQSHAEIEALHALPSGVTARGATLYVTLEPCSTTGKTPPCTQAIIHAGFARVVYGATDPNPVHQGAAQKILEQAGVEVTTGLLAKECEQLNCYWNHRMKTGLPWVIAKCGMSLDGCISSHPERRWITSPASRHDAMHLRAEVEAILVGGNTVRNDNPRLTVRPVSKNQPWRIIWSLSGNVSPTSHVLTDQHRHKTKITTGESLQKIIHALAEHGISSVLMEGGGRTLGEAFDQQLIDEVRFYVAPLLQGGPVPAVGGLGIPGGVELKKVSYRMIGDDVVISGLVKKKNC
ncbi:MAG: bifunctional diaminohydroxyphosphoribosylaminopyrimidine deaminase/5-amino-6-(5-phosphoribosylamino)uracil reductase RibD [Chthoniobacterales bacterium]